MINVSRDSMMTYMFHHIYQDNGRSKLNHNRRCNRRYRSLRICLHNCLCMSRYSSCDSLSRLMRHLPT